MKIEPEFIINELVFSRPLKREYSWNELQKRGFKFTDKHGVEWRVPNRAELITLFDEDELSHCDSIFWSASSHTYFSSYAWYVDFNNGYTDYSDRNNIQSVMLVGDHTPALDIPEFVVLSTITL